MSEVGTGLVASVYPWQATTWGKITDLIEANRLPHALLLSGPSHVGKLKFAEVVAQSILCSAPLAGYACGQCKQCLLLSSNTHPDLLYIEPEDERKPIKIDAIRELGEFLSKTAQQSGWKIAIICPAENMNVNAANALLKSLEEPAENTLLLLVSHDSSRIAATVRSRCRNVGFGTPDKKLVRSWLQQVLPERDDHEILIEQSVGRPLWALTLLERDLLAERRVLEDALAGVEHKEITPLDAAALFLKVDDVIAIDWLQLIVFARIKIESSARQHELFSFLDKLKKAKNLFLSPSNPNRQLLWEELMLDWQKCSATGR